MTLGKYRETFLHSAAIIQVSSTQLILVCFYVHRGWDSMYYHFLKLADKIKHQQALRSLLHYSM